MCVVMGLKYGEHKGSEAGIQPGGHDIVNYKESAVGTVIIISFLSGVFYGYW